MLEFIFITILVIWVLGVVGRWLARRWLLKKQQQFAEQFGGAQGAQQSSKRRNARPEGDVSVQQTAPAQKKVSRNVGDYVEFEEVEIIEQTEQKE